MARSSVIMQEPLVSFIIPAYNVEKYIETCIQSIQKQSVKNIEIIPVDDGSTDGTGNLLDRLASSDNRIYVIHKNNGGVSAARNSGIDVALGKYIVFVDGDDFIASDFIEYMVGLAKLDDSDFCLSVNCFVKQGEEQVKVDKIEKLNQSDATALLLSPRVVVGCWNKIFKREFLKTNDIRFRTDLHYGEGLQFITTASQLANHVTVGSRKVYYYRRDNQYSATTKFNIESIFNGEKAINIIEDQLIVNSEKTNNMLLLHRSMYCVGALVRVKANHKENEYREDYRRWLHFIRSHLWRILHCRDIPFYRKGLISGACISPWIMSRLDIIRRKRNAAQSVST